MCFIFISHYSYFLQIYKKIFNNNKFINKIDRKIIFIYIII
nr:MAG TPA: hypothetical protein [Caudoviricetes sp.]